MSRAQPARRQRSAHRSRFMSRPWSHRRYTHRHPSSSSRLISGEGGAAIAAAGGRAARVAAAGHRDALRHAQARARLGAQDDPLRLNRRRASCPIRPKFWCLLYICTSARTVSESPLKCVCVCMFLYRDRHVTPRVLSRYPGMI